jgi:hypothetical protein
MPEVVDSGINTMTILLLLQPLFSTTKVHLVFLFLLYSINFSNLSVSSCGPMKLKLNLTLLTQGTRGSLYRISETKNTRAPKIMIMRWERRMVHPTRNVLDWNRRGGILCIVLYRLSTFSYPSPRPSFRLMKRRFHLSKSCPSSQRSPSDQPNRQLQLAFWTT